MKESKEGWTDRLTDELINKWMKRKGGRQHDTKRTEGHTDERKKQSVKQANNDKKETNSQIDSPTDI
jgi:hypothetical protein